jgi:hypothetical protein
MGTYVTRFTPTFRDHDLHRKDPATLDLAQLILNKHNKPSTCECTTWLNHNTSNLIQTWAGWTYAPSTLTLALDRNATTVARPCKLTLPLERDFKPMIHESGKKFKYRLVTVIKKLRSGDYAAFAHGEDGRWWGCVSEEVKEVGIGE